MNNEDNQIVKVVNWIVDTFAKTLVSLFDGVKNAIDHANPSLFALVATLLPFVLPLPVAFMTAHSAQKFFDWDLWAANVLGFGLEGLGLLAWVKLVDAVLDWVKVDNQKITAVVVMYGAVALVYEALLVYLNAVLAHEDGANQNYTIVLVGICLLPALSALLYGHHRQTVLHELERERIEKKDQAEKIRQERRADRKEAQALKIQYAKDTEAVKLDKGPFRG